MSAWKEYKQKFGNSPIGLITGDYIDDDIQLARYNVCLSCDELIQLTKQCKQCGCFMGLKTKLKSATCPLGKW